jgi:hypothetical protein
MESPIVYKNNKSTVMRTEKKFQFEKSSPKTAEQIKAACDRMQSVNQADYEIRSNGNHIWVEVEPGKKQYWSPMMHLRLVKSENETRIKGEFAENPLLWAVFTMVKIASVFIFALSGVIAWLKYSLGYNFNMQLFVMFGMVSVWFAMYLISERYKRKGAGQIKELYDFVDAIAA